MIVGGDNTDGAEGTGAEPGGGGIGSGCVFAGDFAIGAGKVTEEGGDKCPTGDGGVGLTANGGGGVVTCETGDALGGESLNGGGRAKPGGDCKVLAGGLATGSGG